MSLEFRQSRDIKQVFVEFVNKIFHLNSQWINVDTEVISVSAENAPNAYEQYPWDNEKYPIVVCLSDGSSDDHWAIDSRIGNFWETLRVGSAARDYVQLGNNPVAFGVHIDDTPLTLRQVKLPLLYLGPYEESVGITLWSSGSLGPAVKLASGSINPGRNANYKWYQTGMYDLASDNVILTANTNYFISVKVLSGSYALMLDNAPKPSITPFVRYLQFNGTNWNIDYTKTGYALLNGPIYRRLGGGLQSNIRLFIEAKDLSTTQKIAELLFIYLHLQKHSNVKRKIKQTLESNQTGMEYDFVSNLSEKGIFIIDVNKGGENVRNRGNDRLFSIELTITCYSAWTEDFVLPELKDINTDDIGSF
jgi:hypothetical protein